MVQALEADLKQIVLTSGPFGPQEIRKLEQAIAEDFSQFRPARRGRRSRGRRRPQPRRLGPAGSLLLPARAYQVAAETLKSADGGALSNFYLGKTNVALGHYDAAQQNYAAAAKAGYNGDDCVLARAEALRLSGDPKGRLVLLDGLSGAVEQTAEYLAQRAACVSLIGGNPQEVVALYERAVESDRNHSGAPVRPGPGKRPPRQRRVGPGTVRAGRPPVSHVHRSAVEPRRAVRRSPAVRSGPAVLSADSGRRPNNFRAGCSSRTPRPRARCTTTRTRSANATG